MTRSRIADVAVVLELREGVAATPSRTLEASLDCHVCGRLDRTVAFREDGATCIGEGHPFPGKLLDLAMSEAGPAVDGTRAVSLRYRAAYEAGDFVDRTADIESSDAVTWARVRLTLTCPACGAATEAAIQNNETRPKTLVCEACDAALGVDATPQPTIDTRPA